MRDPLQILPTRTRFRHANEETEAILAHSRGGQRLRESGTGTERRGPDRQRGHREVRRLTRGTDSGAQSATARSHRESDSGGAQLSVGMPQTSDSGATGPRYPCQGKTTYGRKQ